MGSTNYGQVRKSRPGRRPTSGRAGRGPKCETDHKCGTIRRAKIRRTRRRATRVRRSTGDETRTGNTKLWPRRQGAGAGDQLQLDQKQGNSVTPGSQPVPLGSHRPGESFGMRTRFAGQELIKTDHQRWRSDARGPSRGFWGRESAAAGKGQLSTLLIFW